MRMVAHGAMATAGKVENELQHYVPLGSIVMCVDPYGKKTLEVLIIYSSFKEKLLFYLMNK